MTVTIEYVGSACFRIWREGGPVVVLDPYTPSAVGLPEISIQGDVVVASSLIDAGHFCRELVAGDPDIVDALRVADGAPSEVDGSEVIAVPATEDPNHPGGPKDCAMYGLKIGGVAFAHMGDIGYALGADELAPFRDRCDALLTLAGQTLTPSLEELDEMIDFLRPTWIIPMHYYLEGMTADFEPVDEFLAHRSRDPILLTRTTSVTLPLQRDDSGRPTIVVLEARGLDRPVRDLGPRESA